MVRFEDSVGLFGSGSGVATHGDFTCGICGTEYNVGADERGDFDNEGVRWASFAGIGVGECCFERIEQSVFEARIDILRWLKRIRALRRAALNAEEIEASCSEDTDPDAGPA